MTRKRMLRAVTAMIVSAYSLCAAAVSIADIAAASPLKSANAGERAESRDQSSLALTAAPKTVDAASAQVKSALTAKDVAKAQALTGKRASLQGTVTKVFSPDSHSIVILDFDPDYHHTITVIAKPQAYAKLPDLAKLAGKRVLVTGTVEQFHGSPQIELKFADKIFLVK